MATFWKHYEAAKPHIADAVDDVRHKLVEEGWFSKTQGRTVTGDIAEPDKPAATPAAPEEKQRHPIYEGVWGKAPDHADIYGKMPDVSGAPAISHSPVPALPAPTPDAPSQEQGPAPEL
jgi:hypothetical protein